jgi:signal peptidase II
MTKENKRNLLIVSILIFLILFIDQFSKIWIKTHLMIGESIRVTDWFYIFFVENNGMAFGLELFNKIFLTFFRIIAVSAIGYYLFYIIKKGYNLGFCIGVALIFAGAFGNIIDCVFYGVWFDSSIGQVATFLPENGGYDSWFYGKVVDMLYFPIINTTWPSWIPFVGGTSFTFFDPVFNIADSAICIGVIYIILFQWKYLANTSEGKTENETTNEK